MGPKEKVVILSLTVTRLVMVGMKKVVAAACVVVVVVEEPIADVLDMVKIAEAMGEVWSCCETKEDCQDLDKG